MSRRIDNPHARWPPLPRLRPEDSTVRPAEHPFPTPARECRDRCRAPEIAETTHGPSSTRCRRVPAEMGGFGHQFVKTKLLSALRLGRASGCALRPANRTCWPCPVKLLAHRFSSSAFSGSRWPVGSAVPRGRGTASAPFRAPWPPISLISRPMRSCMADYREVSPPAQPPAASSGVFRFHATWRPAPWLGCSR